jgi:hypothetical protein
MEKLNDHCKNQPYKAPITGKVQFLETGVNLKSNFIKAGHWFLDLTRELDEDIKNWKDASTNTPKDYLIKRYLAHAKRIESQKQRIVRFYDVCSGIVDQYESELWLKEHMETLMILQMAALRQGRKVDVLNTIPIILKKQEVAYGNK